MLHVWAPTYGATTTHVPGLPCGTTIHILLKKDNTPPRERTHNPQGSGQTSPRAEPSSIHFIDLLLVLALQGERVRVGGEMADAIPYHAQRRARTATPKRLLGSAHAAT